MNQWNFTFTVSWIDFSDCRYPHRNRRNGNRTIDALTFSSNLYKTLCYDISSWENPISVWINTNVNHQIYSSQILIHLFNKQARYLKKFILLSLSRFKIRNFWISKVFLIYVKIPKFLYSFQCFGNKYI